MKKVLLVDIDNTLLNTLKVIENTKEGYKIENQTTYSLSGHLTKEEIEDYWVKGKVYANVEYTLGVSQYIYMWLQENLGTKDKLEINFITHYMGGIGDALKDNYVHDFVRLLTARFGIKDLKNVTFRLCNIRTKEAFVNLINTVKKETEHGSNLLKNMEIEITLIDDNPERIDWGLSLIEVDQVCVVKYPYNEGYLTKNKVKVLER